MTRTLLHIPAVLAVSALLAAGPASAERLTLSFLPPDLPPSDICNAEPERFDNYETQIAEAEEPGEQTLDNAGLIQFLTSDIQNLQRDDPDGAFEFILALITRRAELDPVYAGIEETFDRVDTYLAAGRLEELRQAGLIQSLTDRLLEMSWSEAVRLSRFYLNGIGVEQDRDFAMMLILDQAYLGNANALLEVLRMQLRGEEPGDWSLEPDETARLAFGGLVGRLNAGLCNRAERMAREYLDGDLLTPNPELAYAWRKFAADMGGAEAAWRIVEHHLSAPSSAKDEDTIRHYLQKAVANGFVVLPETVDKMIERGARTEAEIREFLGVDHARTGHAERISAVPYLGLDVRITTASIAEDSDYLKYLREVSQLPDVPARIFMALGKETLLRAGRWAAAEEASGYFTRAAELGEPEALLRLAELQLSQATDPATLARAEAFLLDAVDRHGEPAAMKALNTLYRCQLPDSPRVEEADFWAEAYRAANVEPFDGSANTLARLDPLRDPEAIARIQSLAIRGHSGSAADWLQYLQSDRMTPDSSLRYWTDRVSRSDVALERFIGQEFELALTPGERRSAIELYRRVYLDIGSAVSLDLALALIEDTGRDPDVAAEIVELLSNSARRGQGASIRLLTRLTGRDPAEVYAEFAEDIETRGDLVAMTFAAPFVDDAAFERFMSRAISMMNCSTKDIAELTEAYAARGRDGDVLRWIRIGQTLEGGNSLMSLGVTVQQVQDFGRGVSIAHDMLDRPLIDTGRFDRLRHDYLRLSNPNSATFDPDTAGQHLGEIFQIADRDQYRWALARYRSADTSVRRAVDGIIDLRSALMRAAERGDHVAQYELGMFLRAVAEKRADLEDSTDWLSKSAEAGNPDAMFEYAHAVAFGIGQKPDPRLGLIWLDRAQRLHPGRGQDLRALLSAQVSE